MFRNEAQALIDRLMAVYEKDLGLEAMAEYVRQFLPLHHGRAQQTVERIIQDNKYFPKIAEFLATYRKLTQEAAARSQPEGGLCDTPQGKWLMYRQHKIGFLTKEQYWTYVYDEHFRAIQDDEWRQEWKAHLATHRPPEEEEGEHEHSAGDVPKLDLRRV
jgi:hypothetical protein